MKLYCFLSCLPAFLLSTVGNPLPAIDNSARLKFTELNSPSFAGHFDSQLPPNEGSMVQVDTNSKLDPLLFSVASENPDSQTENFSQKSITEEPNSGSDESVCDDEPENDHGSKNGSKNVNKYRIRRNGAMCAVKEEDIDWDDLWTTFSKTRELSNGDAPACPDPGFPVHVCCRGPQSIYSYNPSIFREVKNCAPCKLSPILFLPCRYSGIANIYMHIDLMLCARPYLNICCRTYEVRLIIPVESVFMIVPVRKRKFLTTIVIAPLGR